MSPLLGGEATALRTEGNLRFFFLAQCSLPRCARAMQQAAGWLHRYGGYSLAATAFLVSIPVVHLLTTTPPPSSPPTQTAGVRYPVVVRFEKVNYAGVATNNYGLDEVDAA